MTTFPLPVVTAGRSTLPVVRPAGRGPGATPYRYPSTYVLDLWLRRNIKITEQVNLEVLGEMFNVANTINVTAENTTGYILGGTSAAPALRFNAPFGTVANTNFVYSPRQVQIEPNRVSRQTAWIYPG